jgi:transposase-like protein
VVGPRCHRVRDFAHTRHPSSSYALYCRTPWLLPLRPLALRLRSALNTPHFQDDTQARQHLEAVRWPDGPVCPHCGSAEKPYQLQGKAHRPGLWKCVDCRKQFTVTVGTPFERSKVSLSKWLMAAYLLCSSRKGISARRLHRTLGVTYKTAWRMAHRIREAMLQQNPHLLPTALWLQWILLGEQKPRNQEKVVVNE